MLKMCKKPIILLITHIFLLQSAGLDYLAVKPQAYKDSLRPISAFNSGKGIPTSGIFPVLQYEIEELDIERLKKEIEGVIKAIEKSPRLKKLAELRDEILKDLRPLLKEVDGLKKIDGKTRANYLLRVARLAKDIGMVLEENGIPLSEMPAKSCVKLSHFIQRAALPELLLTEVIDFNRYYQAMPEKTCLKQLNEVLDRLCGVSFDEIMASMSNMTEAERRHWIAINKNLRNYLKDKLGQAEYDRLRKHILAKLHMIKPEGDFSRPLEGAGDLSFVRLIYYFAIKVAEQKYLDKIKADLSEGSGSFFDISTPHPEDPERSEGDEGSYEILQPFGLKDEPSEEKNSPRAQLSIIQRPFITKSPYRLFLEKARKMDGLYQNLLSVSFERIIRELQWVYKENPHLLYQKRHFLEFLSHPSYGLEHALDMVRKALELARIEQEITGKEIDYDAVALGAFFHDNNAPIAPFHHEQVGAEITRNILTELGYPGGLIKKVENAVRLHKADAAKFPEGYLEAMIVRDVDTLDEVTDMDRIVDRIINRSGLSFFNNKLKLDYRIQALAAGKIKVKTEGNDCLLFLLRCVTTDINPNNYCSKAARRFIESGSLLEENKRKILSYAKKYSPRHIRAIERVINNAIKRYRYTKGVTDKIWNLIDYEIENPWDVERLERLIEDIDKQIHVKREIEIEKGLLKDFKQDLIFFKKGLESITAEMPINYRRVQVNFLLEMNRRLKNHAAVLQKKGYNPFGQPLASICKLCRHIQSSTFPEALFRKIRKFKDDESKKNSRRRLKELNALLKEELYGVSLDEVIKYICSLRRALPDELFYWVYGSRRDLRDEINDLLKEVDSAGWRSYKVNLSNLIKQSLHIAEGEGVKYIGDKNWALILHYFAVKAAEGKFKKLITRKKVTRPSRQPTQLNEGSGSFFDISTPHPEDPERSEGDEGSYEILQPFGLQDEPSEEKNSPRAQLNTILSETAEEKAGRFESKSVLSGYKVVTAITQAA